MWAWRLKRFALFAAVIIIAVVGWTVIRPTADDITGGSGAPGFSVGTGGGGIGGSSGPLDAPDPETGAPETPGPTPPEPAGIPAEYGAPIPIGTYAEVCAHAGDQVRFAVTSTASTPETVTVVLADPVSADTSASSPALFEFTAPSTAGIWEISRSSSGAGFAELRVDTAPCFGLN